MRAVQYIPRATEKAYVAQTQNTYVFFVPMKASKQEIAKQISEAFKVTVIDVRTMVRKGKPTRFSRGKHAYPGITFRRDHKIAYITLKNGDKIPVFEEIKEEVKEETKEDKKDAKAEKKAAKAEKKSEEKAEKTAKKVAKKEEKESK